MSGIVFPGLLQTSLSRVCGSISSKSFSECGRPLRELMICFHDDHPLALLVIMKLYESSNYAGHRLQKIK
jgi:hypothetical protein